VQRDVAERRTLTICKAFRRGPTVGGHEQEKRFQLEPLRLFPLRKADAVSMLRWEKDCGEDRIEAKREEQ